MEPLPRINRCRSCGATSYRRLVHRGADGVMRYSGVYCCSGCSLTFTESAHWRERRLRPRVPQQAAHAAPSGGALQAG